MTVITVNNYEQPQGKLINGIPMPEGDPSDFNNIYKQYQMFLTKKFAARCHNWADAEEIYQDTMFSLAKKWDTYTDFGRINNIIQIAAERRYIEYLRDKYKKGEIRPKDEEYPWVKEKLPDLLEIPDRRTCGFVNQITISDIVLKILKKNYEQEDLDFIWDSLVEKESGAFLARKYHITPSNAYTIRSRRKDELRVLFMAEGLDKMEF